MKTKNILLTAALFLIGLVAKGQTTIVGQDTVVFKQAVYTPEKYVPASFTPSSYTPASLVVHPYKAPQVVTPPVVTPPVVTPPATNPGGKASGVIFWQNKSNVDITGLTIDGKNAGVALIKLVGCDHININLYLKS